MLGGNGPCHPFRPAPDPASDGVEEPDPEQDRQDPSVEKGVGAKPLGEPEKMQRGKHADEIDDPVQAPPGVSA